MDNWLSTWVSFQFEVIKLREDLVQFRKIRSPSASEFIFNWYCRLLPYHNKQGSPWWGHLLGGEKVWHIKLSFGNFPNYSPKIWPYPKMDSTKFTVPKRFHFLEPALLKNKENPPLKWKIIISNIQNGYQIWFFKVISDSKQRFLILLKESKSFLYLLINETSLTYWKNFKN